MQSNHLKKLKKITPPPLSVDENGLSGKHVQCLGKYHKQTVFPVNLNECFLFRFSLLRLRNTRFAPSRNSFVLCYRLKLLDHSLSVLLPGE